MVEEVKAREFCRKLVNDAEEDEYAISYARKVLDMNMSGKELEVQLKYIWNNIRKESNKEELRNVMEIDSTVGYRDDYCHICGDRNEDNAYREEGEEADGLVCGDCYDEFGDPEKCTRCEKVTYEGDFLVDSGEFYCNSCLREI